MINKCPMVSVIMPTYKRSDMINRAINSVLAQTYKNIQVVVVDDNDPSSEWREKTQCRMEEYKEDDRVKYILHGSNRNGSVARNTGINNADGEIITFLDDDDEYLPTKVEEQVNYLFAHPEYRAVYCGWNRIVDIIPEGEGDLSFGVLSGSQILITNALMLWKTDLLSAGGFDPLLKRHQEAALMLNYFEKGGLIGRVNKVLVKFDISDRTNSIDSYLNEKIIEYLFKRYDGILIKNEFNCKKSKRKIKAIRYKGILYNYILQKQYGAAVRIFLKCIALMPISFVTCLLSDLKTRI